MIVVVLAALDILASLKAEHDNMPVILEPLRVEFAAECQHARWKYGVGVIDKDLTSRLDTIRRRRDVLLKQRGIRSFKVKWMVEDFAADGQSIKPHAHFSGWYLD